MSASASTAFIINPASHIVRTRGSILADIAGKWPQVPVCTVDDFDALPDRIRQLLGGGVTTLFVEGGDGTVEAVLSACLSASRAGHALPAIAILPGGSTNLAYKMIGFRVPGRRGLRQAVDRFLSGAPTAASRSQHALMVRHEDSDELHVGFLLSTGSVARAMLYTQQNLHDGRRGAIAVARAVAQFALFPKHALHSDGEPVIRPSKFHELSSGSQPSPDMHAFAVLSTFERLSLGMQPFWNRGEHPIAMTRGDWPLRRLRLGVAKLAAGLPGQSLETHGLTSKGCDAVAFRCDGPVVLDGELLCANEDQLFHVTATPALEFVQA